MRENWASIETEPSLKEKWSRDQGRVHGLYQEEAFQYKPPPEEESGYDCQSVPSPQVNGRHPEDAWPGREVQML